MGPSGINRADFPSLMSYCVVPFTVELIGYDVDVSHLLSGRHGSFWVGLGIEFTPHRQSGVGGRGADQVDYHTIADERLGAPVHANERE
jgi:hypothetical protein